jgi:predicted DNA-binding protein with PD1-like motif
MTDALRIESFRSGDMILGRLLPGTDLIPGLLEACRVHGARFAVISSLIGSLRETSFVFIVPAGAATGGIKYGEALHVLGGVEIISCQGMLGEWADGPMNGKPTAHVHYSLVDTKGASYFGHVSDTGNPCLITVEFALKVVEGGTILRRVDPEWGFPIFTFGTAAPS